MSRVGHYPVTYIESDFRRAFVTRYGAEPDFRIWICNVGSFPIRDESGRQKSYFNSGLPDGWPDLTGVVLGTGRLIGFELKGPRTVHPQHQREFGEFLVRARAVYAFYRVDAGIDLDANLRCAYDVLRAAIASV